MLEFRDSLLDCLREADDFRWRHDGGGAQAERQGTPLYNHPPHPHPPPPLYRFGSSPADVSLRVGLAFLSHSSFLPTVYSHFSNLEARKCKLKLVASRPSGSSAAHLSPIGGGGGGEDGAAAAASLDDHGSPADARASSSSSSVRNHYLSRTSSFFRHCRPLPPPLVPDPCRRLNEAEWALFRHAYLVVSYPILGRPQPPPASPAREDYDDGGVSGGNGNRRRSSASSSDAAAAANEDAFRRRRLFPHHHRPPPLADLHASSSSLENDEADSIAAIPEETLTDLLRSIFGLPQESFLLYQQKIRERIGARKR